MDIFRGRKSSRGRRARQAMRQQAQRRRSAPENPLGDLVADERRPSSGHQRRGKRDGAGSGINLSHIAFLLAGLLLGALLFLLLSVLPRLRHAKEEAAPPKARSETPAAVEEKPPAAPAPAIRAGSPVEAVRLMLQASLAGDAPAAYAQWEIGPDEVATVRGGQALTLAEITALTAEMAGKVKLDDLTFEVKEQTGDDARVVQKRAGVVGQIYSVHRTGGVWKIRYASVP